MNENKVTACDLAEGAGSLHRLAIALDKYIFDNVSSTDVSLDDINGLKGIAQAILLMASNHSEEASEFKMN